MGLFERNRNELSRYFYDMSKAFVIAFMAIAVIQEKFKLLQSLYGLLASLTFLMVGSLLPKGNKDD
jgi:hypothetical protein